MDRDADECDADLVPSDTGDFVSWEDYDDLDTKFELLKEKLQKMVRDIEDTLKALEKA